MAQLNRDILEILRRELSFVEDGGYAHAPHAPWRAPAIFEDSPICPKFCDSARPHPCTSCALIEFVPEAQKHEAVPCRFIPLTDDGRTVEDLYRTATHAETQEALAHWLRVEIELIERRRGVAQEKGAA